jgi:hypothetical protein
MLTVFLNPKTFALVNLLPQTASFTVAYFVDNVIIPLVYRQAEQQGDIACYKLILHSDNSKCHIAWHVQEGMARHRCVWAPGPPYLPDLAIVDFCLFGRLKRQLSGRTLDNEQNVLETITEVLIGLLKD